MSTWLAVVLMAAAVVVLAVVWIVITRRARRLTEPEPEPDSDRLVVWMRPRHAWFAHAFHRAELAAHLPDVDPVAWCGRTPVGELVAVDAEAPRCVPCERAVEEMERRE